MTQPPPATRDTLAAVRADLNALDREVGKSETWTDEMATETMLQVIALEEVLAAPWWRIPGLLLRWRADVRASVRHIEGHDFTSKRIHTIGSGWITRPGTGHEVRVNWNPPLEAYDGWRRSLGA